LVSCRIVLQLNNYYYFLSDAFATHHQLDTIYLDISKAFDAVYHAHLLHKQSSFNMSGNLWIWFTEHLVNESQFVSINNTQLYLLPELSGVRQGSILGPLMFILYMNDLPDAIHWSKVLLFADDTICFKQIKSPIDQQHLQLDLDNLASWSISSYLSFNSSKSTHVSLNNRSPTSYNIRNDPLPPPTIIKILELLSAVILTGTSIMIQFLGKLTGP